MLKKQSKDIRGWKARGEVVCARNDEIATFKRSILLFPINKRA